MTLRCLVCRTSLDELLLRLGIERCEECCHEVQPSCESCRFRREGICALSLDAPCPTWRPIERVGALAV